MWEEQGCQVIINGVIPTIKYYMRLIQKPNMFLDFYIKNMERDIVIRSEHKEIWNKIVDSLI